MLLKILIVLLEISPRSTFLRRSSRKHTTNPFTSIPSQDRLQSTARGTVSEEEHQARFRKRLSSRSQCQSRAPSKKDKCLHLNSEDTMIEEICPFALTIKTPSPNWSGKYQSNLWIITTICQFSSMGPDRNSIPIDHSRFWALTICWIREVTKSCQ